MLRVTGRTLTDFIKFVNTCRQVQNAEVDCSEQANVDRHISHIDKLLEEVPEWSNWFPSRDEMRGIVDMLTYERKYTLNKAREYRKESKLEKRHNVA